ncbi:MAG: nickel pincer cofactor biosynthesis protein LarB [Nitrospirae bacterium]|nr:nickel pincer cofactor biosynthesis protein LarB [Nitrospirota bacterium]MBI3605125.1 nickel pincer cofactor biosynthesis protein LarB [Nitrospirota bacterium]
MNPDQIKKLLLGVKTGKTSVKEALSALKGFSQEDLGFAVLDHHRHLRQGFPEVIFCQGKNDRQILALFRHSLNRHPKILATRVRPETFEAIRREFPDARYNELGKTVAAVKPREETREKGLVLIITAGTSDISVAEEARETALILGSRVETLYDVGVAGIHRILDKKKALERARVLIVIAGMDGVLPSVIGGFSDRPLIAVPTSQGYGTAFNGIAPLLTMLNSCASGIGVMNIDNGFGAAVLAHRINTLK